MINQEMKKVVDNSNKDIKELLRLDVDSKAINEEKNSTIYKIVLPQLFTCHKVDFAKNRGSANTLTDLYTESGLNKSRVERIRKVITNKIAQSLIGECKTLQEFENSLIRNKLNSYGALKKLIKTAKETENKVHKWAEKFSEFTAEEQEQATSLIYSKIKEAGFEDTVADLLAEG
tara:strand:+ start:184 stop:708 length:525 start_codon:yes stop_codon:yes gene_type:complete